jgi:hypothetical protein
VNSVTALRADDMRNRAWKTVDVYHSIDEVELLKTQTVGHLAGQGAWLNAGWLRLLSNRPKRCPVMLQALEELERDGVIEAYTPGLAPGDLRRLDEDYRYVTRD